MGNFQKGGSRGGDRGGFRGGDRDRGPVTMHRAVCADCGQSCEVPFRPTGDKPVFCNNCFGGKREGGDRRDSRSSEPRREFNTDRPTISSSKPAEGSNEIKKQLNELGMKIDRLVLSIERMGDKNRQAPIVIKEAPKAEVKEKSKTEAKEEVKKAPTLKTVIKKAVTTKEAVKKAPVKKVVAKKKK